MTSSSIILYSYGCVPVPPCRPAPSPGGMPVTFPLRRHPCSTLLPPLAALLCPVKAPQKPQEVLMMKRGERVCTI